MEYPVQLIPTTRRRHITGTTALNTPEGRRLGGDWHEQSTWFATRRASLSITDLTDEATYGRLLDRLGSWGVRDARDGLAELRHPGGHEESTVWIAAHDRAVIEEGWRDLTRNGQQELREPPFARDEIERILRHPDQWIRLHWWAWRLRGIMTARERELWDRWRREWRPW